MALAGVCHTVPPVLSVTLPGLQKNVAVARHWLREHLADLGFPPDEVDTAVLVASELVSNAVRHTLSGSDGGRFELVFDPADPWLYIGVTDEGGQTIPTPEPLDDLGDIDIEWLPTSGMGLATVERLALDWGFRPSGPGRTTWATIARRPA